ncbi:MAG: DUF805 domain-containing protein [Caulobacterales bacterium]|jgi:uncharacterized membrane protein YhaH (DUF805 family)
MNGQVDWGEIFFSAVGRAPRMPSWIATAILVVFAALYETIPSLLHWLSGWFVYPVLIYCGACVLSKRLHDRGRSGWWAALVLFATVAVWPQPNSFFDFFFTLVIIWAVIDLGVMPGEAGTNRYGPNPLRPQALA